MTDRARRRFDRSRLRPELLSAGLIALLLSLASVTRDFGWFLAALMAVPVLLIVTLACTVWRVFSRRDARTIPLVLAIVAASWPLSTTIQAAWDWTGITTWSLTHRDAIAANAGKDAILTMWGDWGWAGGSTFAYVAFDAADDSRSVAGAERWRRRLHLDCPLVDSRRIRAHLYLVETSDCSFNGPS